jgi:hypothetical protein
MAAPASTAPAVGPPTTRAGQRLVAPPSPRGGGDRPFGVRRFDPATVAERLLAEFAGQLDAPTVRRTVADCAADISAVPAPALPELVERSARQRLMVLCDPQPLTMSASRRAVGGGPLRRVSAAS